MLARVDNIEVVEAQVVECDRIGFTEQGVQDALSQEAHILEKLTSTFRNTRIIAVLWVSGARHTRRRFGVLVLLCGCIDCNFRSLR
jgi:hypothetical protein